VLNDVIAAGCSPVAMVPCFLFPGAREAAVLAAAAGGVLKRPGLSIRAARPLAEHEATPDILADEITMDAMQAPGSVAVLAAAGSVALANREAVEKLAGAIRTRVGVTVRFGFLDQGEPSIATVMSETLSARPPFVCVLPCLMTPGRLMRDLTNAIVGWRISYQGVRITLGGPLVADPRTAAIIVAEAEGLLS
jgi:sirohydrochlorin ferrochelatase